MAVEITNNIGPTGANGGTPAQFPTHLDTFGYGGYRTVADQNERLGVSGTLTELRRAEGMSVYQVDVAKLFILTTNPAGATTNTGDWTEFSSGGTDLITYDGGVLVTATTTSYDFIGTGVLVSNVGDDVTIDIPGGAGPAYNWIMEDDAATTKVVSAGETVYFNAGAGISATIGPGATPYEIRIANAGYITVSDDEAIPNTSVVDTDGTDTLTFIGTNGITTTVASLAKTVTIDGAGNQTSNITHNKMWSGDASDEAYESDILEASNTGDSNLFKVEGDADTTMIIGNAGTEVNLQTEVYSYTANSLILGRDNGGAHTAVQAVVIGSKAVEKLPADTSSFSNFVVIGYGAQNDCSGVTDGQIRDSVVIGTSAGHQIPTNVSNYKSVVLGYSAGNRVGHRDVIIGANAGSDALQKITSFSTTVVGYQSYSSGDSGVVIGDQSHTNGIGFTGGSQCFPLASANYYNVIIGYQTYAGSNSVSIGYRASAVTNSISIGFESGQLWDNLNDEASYNTFIGLEAGRGEVGGSSQGDYNIAIGTQAFYLAGYDGGDPLLTPTAAARNVCIGQESGRYLRSNSNIAIGHYALRNYKQTHYANEGNVVIGDEAGTALDGTTSASSNNVMIGSEAGTNLTDGAQNVFVGGQAGLLGVKNNNVVIGYRSQYGGGTLTGVLSDMVIIGDNAYNDHTATVSANSVNIGAGSVGELKSTVVGATAKGYDSGIALGYDADQRNKGALGTSSYSHLISISPDTTDGFYDSTKGDANENGNAGNYCFFSNDDALSAGLKHGDIYIESDGEGSNDLPDGSLGPYRLCIVIEISAQ